MLAVAFAAEQRAEQMTVPEADCPLEAVGVAVHCVAPVEACFGAAVVREKCCVAPAAVSAAVAFAMHLPVAVADADCRHAEEDHRPVFAGDVVVPDLVDFFAVAAAAVADVRLLLKE